MSFEYGLKIVHLTGGIRPAKKSLMCPECLPYNEQFHVHPPASKANVSRHYAL